MPTEEVKNWEKRKDEEGGEPKSFMHDYKIQIFVYCISGHH